MTSTLLIIVDAENAINTYRHADAGIDDDAQMLVLELERAIKSKDKIEMIVHSALFPKHKALVANMTQNIPE